MYVAYCGFAFWILLCVLVCYFMLFFLYLDMLGFVYAVVDCLCLCWRLIVCVVLLLLIGSFVGGLSLVPLNRLLVGSCYWSVVFLVWLCYCVCLGGLLRLLFACCLSCGLVLLLVDFEVRWFSIVRFCCWVFCGFGFVFSMFGFVWRGDIVVIWGVLWSGWFAYS